LLNPVTLPVGRPGKTIDDTLNERIGSPAKIAKSLKRTPSATRQKASSLGLSLDTRG
jgi:hypothetical protein